MRMTPKGPQKIHPLAIKYFQRLNRLIKRVGVMAVQLEEIQGSVNDLRQYARELNTALLEMEEKLKEPKPKPEPEKGSKPTRKKGKKDLKT